ncbi:MAG: hypothetical protein R3E12_10615 [Candidatus Eisenbacteria bacterium]|uniref:Uncharacterized protein n=1 Tax=Eiseniibacteriota bacterium TaxID=2212470 RepID=A0A956LVR0_UNCEI|nr:hypothetical protein [Candidatus Eisenbacteria bacterium]
MTEHRRRLRKLPSVVLCIDVVAILAFAGLAAMNPGYVPLSPAFDTAMDATSMRLRYSGGGETLVSDPDALAAFRGQLRLQPFGPCLSIHAVRVFFQAPGDTAWADVGEGCFHYHDRGEVRHYRSSDDLADWLAAYAPNDPARASRRH